MQELLRRIREVNNRWKSIVSAITSVTELDDYSFVIIQASKIAEQIIQEIGVEKGYSFEDGYYTDSKGYSKKPFFPLSFIKEERVMPPECNQFCNEIFSKRNQAVHSLKVSYGEMVGFVNTFNSFVAWFTSIHTDLLDDAEKYLLLNSLPSVSEIVNVSLMKGDLAAPLDSTEALRKTKNLVESSSETQQEDTNRQLLTMLKENSALLHEIKDGTVRIEAKVDSLAEQVRGLSAQIENYQSLVQRQLEMASSSDEIEHIIHAYIEECASKVLRFFDGSYSEQIYNDESERLILSFGETAWSKLDDSSKTFLISAKVIFNKLSGISDLIDYSGVCLLVTKALEVEVSNRFGKVF